MNEIVAQTLQSIPRMLHNSCVFYGRNLGERFIHSIKNTDWKKYLKEVGIKDLHWHDLRHTFASRWVMRGVDLYTLSKLLSNHSLGMTERYAHLAPDYLKNAVEVLAIPGAQVTPKVTPVVNETATPSFQITRP